MVTTEKILLPWLFQQAIENYRKMVMEYADSLSRVRELCDRAVDPMDFAQAAGMLSFKTFQYIYFYNI